MRYILKQKEPQAFTDWKIQEDATLQKWYADNTKKGGKIWGHLLSTKIHVEERIADVKYYSKEELRAQLLAEQGYICCYCGCRIDNSVKTIVEHLYDKGSEMNKHRTFDYFNLYASCSGGNPGYYTVKKSGEKVEEICGELGADLKTLEENNKRLDLSDLKKGDKVIYQKNEKHCDAEKNKYPIFVTPEQVDCEGKFTYKRGKLPLNNNEFFIHAKNQDSDAITTIKTLGLNKNKILRKRRRDAFSLALDTINAFVEIAVGDDTMAKRALEAHFESLDQIPTNGKLEEFCFVQRFFIRQFIDN